ncbi:MAG: hypothetical protein ACLQGP_01915 [Isosphaeraceae bacterium]
MRVAIADRPIRWLRRFCGALAIPMLLGWIGCATFDRGQTLLPTRPQVQTGQFRLLSNTPMTGDSSAVRCLRALERDVEQYLGFRSPATDDPVEIYVLDDRSAFDHFLKYYHPELPQRRAFFLAQGDARVVYTYANPRIEEDLRHEGTHALLHGAFGDIPLWLDEGLAEYFENDLSAPDSQRARLEQMAADLRGGWSPNLERLEAMTDIRQMTPRDYREAWGWVHLFLNGPETGKSILMGYLGEAERTGDNAHIAPRLALAKITNERMLAHLTALQAGPVASKPVREAASVRLQDDAIDSTPTSSASPRGLLRRIRAMIGL